MNRGTALTLSLLVAMGLVPAACSSSDGTGGTTPGGTAGEGGDGGSGGSAVHPGAGEAGADVQGGGGAVYRVGTCTNPKVDPISGLVKCDEGFSHRTAAKQCQVVPAGAGEESAGGASAGGAGGAGADVPASDLPRANGEPCGSAGETCSEFQYGYCVNGGSTHYCASGCVTDADCGSGSVCVCESADSPTGGRCAPADCKTDKDCGTGLCATYDLVCGGTGFACQSAKDACVSSDDCTSGICNYQPHSDLPASLHRYCDNAACGRPFLVHNEARVAPVTRSAAWRGSERLKPCVEHLTDSERASLAAHWTKLGQLEHASIAAFARFQLQLLALGAPPDLVEGCTRALADETAHTKLCFELASAYAGRAVGPGPLDIEGSLTPTSLGDVVDLVIAEGCFGETGAALEALEAADGASDPVIVAAYAQIAADEQRHAELGFRFVRWAIQQDVQMAARVRSALVAPRDLPRAVVEVVETCLYALLAQRAAA